MADGALDEAVRLQQETLRLALDAEDDDGFAYVLICMGHIAAMQGRPEVALVLAGAADALRQETGIPWASPWGSDEWDQLVRVAGEDLPAELINARLVEGHALTRDQVIRLVRQQGG
jgi:hypothetical protein